MDIVTSLAASRLVAQQRVMEVTANNIANANTPGYRTERVQFSDWIDRQHALVPGAPSGDHNVIYTQDRATWRESQSGTITHTGNPFDLALSGEGYFTVSTPTGPRLTRDGRFGLTSNGTLADSNGNPVLNTNGQPILISAADTNVTIASDGSISSENGPLGKIGVVQPADMMKLSAEGATRFVSNAPTTPVATPGIVQGAVEDSNVQPVMEISRMIDDSRQFQLMTQFVQSEADRQQNAIDKVLSQSNT
ncbi:flagellar basal-body rod protein FlgF [Rhodopila sp.]|uniref:flagellar basal-body rod protein FlgF n=1 Tax=Rhodopila sp. TaxID=2480087 RepID=UPI002CFBF64D|nr:flagellar basal-body rod protein FlgF [Rhodopila sp.]HVZ08423.1 flagellar basal-body rod protein FlgF [Rhodopila sp.]